MTSQLFSPFDLGPIRLPNRIVVAPMCQYSADDGSPTDWHIAHWMQMGYSGAGLMVVEATGVERHGRITYGCTGLYSDSNEDAMKRCLDAARRHAGPAKFGIQLGHAGRKASSQRPWEGGKSLGAGQDPWITSAPSAIPFDDGWHTPVAMDEAAMARVRDAFVQAAERAVRIGFDSIELHMAHGYLLHSFLTPLANQRTDGYGGSRENRMRYPLSVARAVRAAVPKTVALGARLSTTDWHEQGWTIEDSVVFTKELKKIGLDFLCASSGGASLKVKVPVAPGYQVPMAQRIRAETGIATRAVGMIADPEQAELIIRQGQADLVALARAMLDNPRWGWHAADKLGAKIPYPVQYERSRATLWPGAALARPATLQPAA